MVFKISNNNNGYDHDDNSEGDEYNLQQQLNTTKKTKTAFKNGIYIFLTRINIL
jgi:hypothetical protein